MADENPNPPKRPARRAPVSNVEPMTALYFVLGILLVVGLLTLAIALVFGRGE